MGATGKVPVFGLLKRGGKVFADIIPDAKSKTVFDPNYSKKVIPDSIVYTDTFRSYNALVVSEFKHVRINHSKLFAANRIHIYNRGMKRFKKDGKHIQVCDYSCCCVSTLTD